MPPHQQGLLQLGPQPCAHDLLSSAWIALALLGLRWVCDRTVVPALARALAKHGRGDKAMHAFDDMYIVVWAVGTEAVAVYLTVADNGGCTPLSTEPCWTGFPHAMSLAQRWYMLAMFQGYLHELVGGLGTGAKGTSAEGKGPARGLIGIGPKLKQEMLIHHLATMTLISSAYLLNLSRFGIMWQALFDVSNPFLHTAKMLNTIGLPKTEAIKWPVFALFALLFFAARIAAAPISIVWPAVKYSSRVLPGANNVVLTLMLAIVCGIQWFFFYKIVRMAAGADKPESPRQAGAKKAQ